MKNLAATAHRLGHTEISKGPISIRDKPIMEVRIHKLRGKKFVYGQNHLEEEYCLSPTQFEGLHDLCKAAITMRLRVPKSSTQRGCDLSC